MGEPGRPTAVKAQLPRLPKQLVDVLSREEIQAMEDAAQTERDKLIVRTLADTGVRVGELVARRPADVRLWGALRRQDGDMHSAHPGVGRSSIMEVKAGPGA